MPSSLKTYLEPLDPFCSQKIDISDFNRPLIHLQGTIKPCIVENYFSLVKKG
jgi:hypothetical protein